jgi:acyl carrier protein
MPALWLVTRGGQPVAGDVAAPWQSALWGLGRVLAEEHHEAYGATIDLDPAGSAEDAAAALLATFSTSDAETGVAWRSVTRYVPRLVHVPAATVAPLALRPDGAYVVTGAFGGAGRLVARWLLERGARHLVLVGRSPLPPRERWATIDPRTSDGERIGIIRALEGAGGSVHVSPVAIDDEPALDAWFAAYAAELRPPVRGVVHCAVAVEPALLSAATPGSLAAAFSAKCAGAFVLDRVLAGAPLDFFVSFSSIAALLPQAGQASYAAANTFLDAFASWQRGGGRPGLSIGWGVWRGVGVAAGRLREGTRQVDAAGLHAFEPDQGIEALATALSLDRPYVAVLPADWNAYGAARGAAVPPLVQPLVTASAVTGTTAAPAAFRERLDAASEADRPTLLERHLQELAARVLRMAVDRLDPQTALGTLGLESLMAMELRSRIEASLNLKIPVTLIWNYPTIRALAGHLAPRLRGDAAPAGHTTTPPQAPGAAPAADLDAVSDEQALRLLMEGGG